MDADAKRDQFIAPYVAWKTILNQLDRFEPGKIPPRIDRSILDNLSGGYRGHVMSAFRNLGFIEEDGTVTAVFRALVENPGDRQNVIAGVLRSRYAEALQLAEANASSGELEDVFRNNYGVSGSTLVKAITFFLSAASYAEVQTSAHWRKPAQPRTPRANRPINRKKPASNVETENTPAPIDSVEALRVRVRGDPAEEG